MTRSALILLLAAVLSAPATAQTIIAPPVSTAGLATASDIDAKISSAIAPLAKKTDIPAPADLTSYAKAADLATMQSSVMAAIPQPSSIVGSAEKPGGAAGVASTYKRGDWTPDRISRTGTCSTIGTTGACTGTWDTASFPSGVTPKPVGDPAPVNSSATNPIQCNFTAALTQTGFAAKCWYVVPTTLPGVATSLLGLIITPFSPAPAGTIVNVTALPSS